MNRSNVFFTELSRVCRNYLNCRLLPIIFEDKLYSKRSELENAINELEFWEVKLTDASKELHNSFRKDFKNIHTVIGTLNNQIQAYYCPDMPSEERKTQVKQKIKAEKKFFEEKLSSITKNLEKLNSMGFKGNFVFSQ